MNNFLLIWKNITYQPVRSLLVTVSIALSVAMFCLLVSFDRALNSSTHMTEDRHLVVVNALSYDYPIPIKYRNRVAEIDGVSRVFPVTWFGGNNDAAPGLITGYATKVLDYVDSYRHRISVAPEALKSIAETKSGILIGVGLARRMGWTPGMTIVINSRKFAKASGSKDWEFEIVGLFEGSKPETDTNYFLFANKYFNDTRQDFKWMVGSLIVEPESDASVQDLMVQLDATFETEEPAIQTMSELEFAQSFISQLGNVSLAIWIIVTAAFCTTFLIAANMMAMTIRQRRFHIGVLKAIGFTNDHVIGTIVAEAVLIFVFGTVIGVLIGGVMIMGVQNALMHVVTNMMLTYETISVAFAISVLMGLAAGAIPSVQSTNITVREALTRK